VPGIPADTTNNIRCKVALLGADVLAMSNLTTVLTSLVLIITKGAIHGSERSKLVLLVFILTFGG
jgi:hypothetical protein